jgi:3-phosphoshikimate 1-carboxyvinyltransferase
MMIRAAAAGLLCRREIRIHNPSTCDDASAALRIIAALGADHSIEKNALSIGPGSGTPRSSILDCGESGLCIRLFTPIAGLYADALTLEASGSLRLRPLTGMDIALADLGCRCRLSGDLPPVHIQGPLEGGEVHIDGARTSQFLSGLLMALPLCGRDSQIVVAQPKSKPYIRMTLSLLKDFGITIHASPGLDRFKIPGGQGYRADDFIVEGDWSGAAFLLTAGALAGRITVHNLSPSSHQADKGILDALKAAGAELSIKNGSVTVARSRLQGFEFDATHAPDLFPPLVALACFCPNRTVIRGVERLRFKESDRAATLVSEFQKLGAAISLNGNALVIHGGRLPGGEVASHGDHRIAMACAVAGLRSLRGVGIDQPDCVAKSYPDFYSDLASLQRRLT